MVSTDSGARASGLFLCSLRSCLGQRVAKQPELYLDKPGRHLGRQIQRPLPNGTFTAGGDMVLPCLLSLILLLLCSGTQTSLKDSVANMDPWGTACKCAKGLAGLGQSAVTRPHGQQGPLANEGSEFANPPIFEEKPEVWISM